MTVLRGGVQDGAPGRGNEQSVTRVVGIAGSLRRDSYNRALLRAAQALAPQGVVVESFDRLREIPFFNADLEAAGDPAAVIELKAAVGAADALLIVTPEYNRGLPAVTKNAIDWLSRPLLESVLLSKPVALMGVSTGRGGAAGGLEQARAALEYVGSQVLDRQIAVGRAQQRFDEAGRLVDQETQEEVRDALAALRHLVRPHSVQVG